VDADSAALDRLSGGENHQGIAAYVGEKEYSTIEEILETAAERGEKPLIVVCDGIEDPHNLGAVIRCAECAGAHGVIIPERRACGLTPAVSKASAGAILHMKIARVGNIAQTIEKLKESGIWTFAAEAGGIDFYDADFNLPCAIVLGGEDSGVSRLVKERCDFIVSIPMYGHVNSLNVSTAASVLLCRAARMQRQG
jgi:23S rRNA (guanosine2251-2'-O)-methyltransferase